MAVTRIACSISPVHGSKLCVKRNKKTVRYDHGSALRVGHLFKVNNGKGQTEAIEYGCRTNPTYRLSFLSQVNDEFWYVGKANFLCLTRSTDYSWSVDSSFRRLPQISSGFPHQYKHSPAQVVLCWTAALSPELASQFLQQQF